LSLQVVWWGREEERIKEGHKWPLQRLLSYAV